MAPQDFPGFVELSYFRQSWDDLKLTDKDFQQLQIVLGEDPESGDVVPGAVPLRKLRFAAPSMARGKRGGLRVYYANVPAHGIVVLAAVYSKSDADDLTRSQIKELLATMHRYLSRQSHGETQAKP